MKLSRQIEDELGTRTKGKLEESGKMTNRDTREVVKESMSKRKKENNNKKDQTKII